MVGPWTTPTSTCRVTEVAGVGMSGGLALQGVGFGGGAGLGRVTNLGAIAARRLEDSGLRQTETLSPYAKSPDPTPHADLSARLLPIVSLQAG